MRDHYRVLQVDPSADAEVIAAAYRVLARKLHPDSAGSRDAERMTELNSAYAVLRDPTARAAYDRERRSGAPLRHAPPPGDPPRPPAPARGEDARLAFGRYEGWTLREIARRDIGYVRWLERHASGVPHRVEIRRLLRELDPERSAPPRR